MRYRITLDKRPGAPGEAAQRASDRYPDGPHLRRVCAGRLFVLELAAMSSSASMVIIAMLVLNLVTFVVFAYDKGCAGRGARRISERTLFLLMSLGGSPGGWLAMLSLHHKNRKTSFRSVALLIVVVQDRRV